MDLCGYRNTWTYVGIGIVEPYETRKIAASPHFREVIETITIYNIYISFLENRIFLCSCIDML